MEDIIQRIEERNLKQARLNTILDLTRLYGDLRAKEQEYIITKRQAPSQHTFDFTDLASECPEENLEGSPEEGKVTEVQEKKQNEETEAKETNEEKNKVKEATNPQKETGEETEKEGEIVEEVKLKSPFAQMSPFTSQEGEKKEEDQKEKERRNTSIFENILGTEKDTTKKTSKKTNTHARIPDEALQKRSMAILKKYESLDYKIYPTPGTLEKKDPKLLARVKGFSMGNSYAKVLFLDYMSLLEIDKASTFTISDINPISRDPGIQATGYFLDKRAKVKLLNLSKHAIKDQAEREENSKQYIDLIQSTFDLKEILFDKESDTLSYTVNNFKRIGSL